MRIIKCDCATVLDEAQVNTAENIAKTMAYLCPYVIDPRAERLCSGKITTDCPNLEMCIRCWLQPVPEGVEE